MVLIKENVFESPITGKAVHLWKDSKGRYWLASSKWSLFKTRVEKEDVFPVRFEGEADAE